jgi:hypothetical protein
MSDSKSTPDLRLLGLGALLGLVAAGVGLLNRPPSTLALPDGALARVNDVIISHERYVRTLARTENAGNRDAIDLDMDLLDRLIDDELLVQRAITLGMAQSDLVVRQAVIDSLVASITAEADAASPSDEEMTEYLHQNANRFSYTARIWLDVWQSDSESIAQEFIQRLRNDADVVADGDIQSMVDLPASLIPTDTAANYVGPSIVAATANMPTGSSAVFARRGQWLVVRLRGKELSAVTDLSLIRNRVLISYRRNLAQASLTQYVNELRQRADITVSTP